jgi:CBS domain-containing protein
MGNRHVGATLVIDEGVLRGIFTERDLLQRVVAAGSDPQTTFVAQVMTHDPFSLGGDRQGIEAMRIMREEGIRHVAVTGLSGIGYGIISMRDFLGEEVAAFEREFEFEDRVWQEV